MVPADVLAGMLDGMEVAPDPSEPTQDAPLPSWRVLLWTVDPETRIGKDELLEAVGRPVSWLYRRTAPKSVERIPHRRLDGQLVFVVGEVRRWLRDHEDIVVAGPLDRPRLHVGGR
jgi:hypothetical protein